MPIFRSLRLIVFEKNRLGGGFPLLSRLSFLGGILEYFHSKVGLSKIRSQRLTLTEQIRIISSLTSLTNLLILPKTFRLLSKYLICQISHIDARYCQAVQLFSLFQRSKNMIIIVLSLVCTSRKNDGIFPKRQNSKIPQNKNWLFLFC